MRRPFALASAARFSAGSTPIGDRPSDLNRGEHGPVVGRDVEREVALPRAGLRGGRARELGEVLADGRRGGADVKIVPEHQVGIHDLGQLGQARWSRQSWRPKLLGELFLA